MMARAWTALGVAITALLLLTAVPASAVGFAPPPIVDTAGLVQPVQAVVGSKNCQVIRSCNFSKRARVSGCLSSFSCRACRFVRQSGVFRLQCRWGGPPN